MTIGNHRGLWAHTNLVRRYCCWTRITNLSVRQHLSKKHGPSQYIQTFKGGSISAHNLSFVSIQAQVHRVEYSESQIRPQVPPHEGLDKRVRARLCAYERGLRLGSTTSRAMKQPPALDTGCRYTAAGRHTSRQKHITCSASNIILGQSQVVL